MDTPIKERGYKFKAWHPQWGCFIKLSNLSLEYSSQWVLMSDFQGNQGYHWFKKSDVKILEWTGLTDKVGADIYEGDIIFSVDDMQQYEVVFHRGMYCVYFPQDDTYSPLMDYTWDSLIVGSRLETPEYLTKNPEEFLLGTKPQPEDASSSKEQSTSEHES